MPYFRVRFFVAALISRGMRGVRDRAAHVSFASPTFETLPGGFSRAVFPATVQAGKPGEPSYPFRGVQALLPARGVDRERADDPRRLEALGGSRRLHPAQAVVPGMALDGAKGRFLYHAAAYAAAEWVYPPEPSFRTSYLRGHAIASGPCAPLGYLPATGETGYYGTIDVVIETAPSDEAREALRLLRADPETTERVSRIVANPGDLSSYEGRAARLVESPDDFEYLIVTSADLADDFLPLRNFHTRRGLRARIMTVEEIAGGYGGVDTAERIRNAVTAAYIQHGVTHVLLAGDWDGAAGAPKIVPFRGLSGEVHSSELYTDANMPGDLYFAALDGTWNADGDALWGEPGEDDPYSEVAVGRAPVDTPEEAAVFTQKTIAYQETPVAAGTRRALLLGEKLWNDPLTYGDDEMELLVGLKSDNGFTTDGIPTDFSIVRKYDRTLVWTKADGPVASSTPARTGSPTRGTRIRDTSCASSAATSPTPSSSTTASGRTSPSSARPDATRARSTTALPTAPTRRPTASPSRWSSSITAPRPSSATPATDGSTRDRRAGRRSISCASSSTPFSRKGTRRSAPRTRDRRTRRRRSSTSPTNGSPAPCGGASTSRTFSAIRPSTDGPTRPHRSPSRTPPGSADTRRGSRSRRAWRARSPACTTTGSATEGARRTGPATSISRGFLPFPDSIAAIELDVVAHDRYVYRDTLSILEATPAGGLPPPVAALEQNVPNPFNPSTVIRFTLARDERDRSEGIRRGGTSGRRPRARPRGRRGRTPSRGARTGSRAASISTF